MSSQFPSSGPMLGVIAKAGKFVSDNFVQQAAMTLVAGTADAAFRTHGAPPMGLGVFRVDPDLLDPGARADVLLGPVPLYGVHKIDWSESESDVKFRAQKSQFFGHQEGDTFAKTIHGRITGDLVPVMVNILRLMRLLSMPRFVEAQPITEADIRRDVMITQRENVFVSKDVDIRGFQIRQLADDQQGGMQDARLNFAINQWQTMKRWAFPVVLPYTSFPSCFIETANFSQVADEDGQRTVTYSIFLRRYKDEPRRVHGIMNLGVRAGKRIRVAISYYRKPAIPTFIRRASHLYTMLSTTWWGAVSAMNIHNRLSVGKLQTLNSVIRTAGFAGEVGLDVKATSHHYNGSTEAGDTHVADNLHIDRVYFPGEVKTSKISEKALVRWGQASIPLPDNLARINLNLDEFPDFEDSVYMGIVDKNNVNFEGVNPFPMEGLFYVVAIGYLKCRAMKVDTAGGELTITVADINMPLFG